MRHEICVPHIANHINIYARIENYMTLFHDLYDDAAGYDHTARDQGK